MSGRVLESLPDETVSLRGADARRFCNSMFSNNARDLQVGTGQLTAMLDDRGRVGGLLHLLCVAEDHFLATLQGVTAEDFNARYALFVVLDEVEIQTRRDASVYHVAGVSEIDALPEGCVAYPRDRTGNGGVDLVGPAEQLVAWRADCALPTLVPEDAERQRVMAGIPHWPGDFGPKSLAHQMRMKADYLSFEKGCYVGQETVNRIDVMGQVKRVLVGVELPDAMPPHDAELRVGPRTIGRLTSPVAGPGGGAVALAVVRKPHDADGTEAEAVTEHGPVRAILRDLPMLR